MGWRAYTPAASAASDLRVQLAGSIHLVDPKNLDELLGRGVSETPERYSIRSDPVHASTDRWGEESTPTHTHGVTKLQIITARSTRYRSILPTRRMCVLLRHCYGSTGKFSTPRALRIRAKTETISSQPKTKQTASLDFGRSANSNEFRV